MTKARCEAQRRGAAMAKGSQGVSLSGYKLVYSSLKHFQFPLITSKEVPPDK